MSRYYTILSIDGGGIRGIIPAIILTEIERRTGCRIAQMFDLIAGTSTGGILALGLSVPHAEEDRPKFEAKELVSFYEEDGVNVFHSFWKNVSSIYGLINERYPSNSIEAVLKKYLGTETRLSQALNEILITSYELETCRPYFFTRRRARDQRSGPFDPPMWEVARATSAAPTYFEPFQVERPESLKMPPLTLIDAGVFVNNPTLCAYAEAVDIHSQQTRGDGHKGSSGATRQSDRPVEVLSMKRKALSKKREVLNDFEYLVVSLGTGELDMRIHYEAAKNWGTIHWARPMIDIAYDGSSDTVDELMRQLLPVVKKPYLYYRFQASLSDENSRLDDTSQRNINDLKLRAEAILEDAEKSAKIDNLCSLLKERADAKAGEESGGR